MQIQTRYHFRRSTFAKRLTPGAVSVPLLLCLFLTGCSLLPAGRSLAVAESEATPTPIPTAVVAARPTYEVQRGEVVKEMNFNGRVTPVLEEELFFRASGRVRAVFVERNAQIEEGQVIAELEIDDLEQERQAAQLNLERARARLESARQDLALDRRVAEINLEIAQLRLQELTSQETADAESASSDGASTEVSVQEKQVELAGIALDRIGEEVDPLLVNDVERAELALERLDSAVADATLVAPFDGLLRNHSLAAGREVQAFDPVVIVADTSEMELSASLLNSQLQELEEGMEVTVVHPDRPSESLSGTIRQLPYPYGTGGDGTADGSEETTRIALDRGTLPEAYGLGNLVRVHVVLERREDVLWLPPQAIRIFDGRRFVLVRDGESEQRVDVSLGLETFDRTEIVDGLSEGQVVVGQ